MKGKGPEDPHAFAERLVATAWAMLPDASLGHHDHLTLDIHATLSLASFGASEVTQIARSTALAWDRCDLWKDRIVSVLETTVAAARQWLDGADDSAAVLRCDVTVRFPGAVASAITDRYQVVFDRSDNPPD